GPGGRVGLWQMLSSLDPRHRAFAVLSLLLVIGFVLEATPFGVNANSVLERYAFYGAPLIAIAFVWTLESGLAQGRAYAILACASAVLVFVFPVSSPMLGRTIEEAPSLLGLSQFGIGGLGATVLWAPALTILSLGVAWRRIPSSGSIIAASAICLAVGVAVSRDYARLSQRGTVPETGAPRSSALVTSAGADQDTQMEILFWNPGISRVLVIGGGEASDGYPAIDATLARGGAFVASGQRRLA